MVLTVVFYNICYCKYKQAKLQDITNLFNCLATHKFVLCLL